MVRHRCMTLAGQLARGGGGTGQGGGLCCMVWGRCQGLWGALLLLLMKKRPWSRTEPLQSVSLNQPTAGKECRPFMLNISQARPVHTRRPAKQLLSQRGSHTPFADAHVLSTGALSAKAHVSWGSIHLSQRLRTPVKDRCLPVCLVVMYAIFQCCMRVTYRLGGSA